MNKVKYYLLALSLAMMGYGVYRDEVNIVFKKAINICLECIGVG